jgi:hypothetical protein
VPNGRFCVSALDPLCPAVHSQRERTVARAVPALEISFGRKDRRDEPAAANRRPALSRSKIAKSLRQSSSRTGNGNRTNLNNQLFQFKDSGD